MAQQTAVELGANYHKLQGKESRLLAWKDAGEARRLIAEGLQQAKVA